MTKKYVLTTLSIIAISTTFAAEKSTQKRARRNSTVLLPDVTLSTNVASQDVQDKLNIKDMQYDAKSAETMLNKLKNIFGSYEDTETYRGAEVIDISYPALKKYIIKEYPPQGESVPISQQEISSLLNKDIYSETDLPNILRFVDMLEDRAKMGTLTEEDLDNLTKLTVGDDQTQRALYIYDNDQHECKEIFKEMLKNYTGFQRVIAIVMLKLLPLDYNVHREPTSIYFYDRSGSSEFYSYSNYIHLYSEAKDITTDHRKYLASVLQHELSHLWQYLLNIGESISEYTHSFIINNMLLDEDTRPYMEMYFPMLKRDVFKKNVDYITSKLSDITAPRTAQFEYDKLKNILSNSNLDCLLSDKATKENIAKAIYLYSTCNSSFYKKQKHIWSDPLEMLTIVGVIPFKINNKIVLLVDRQNENVSIARNKQGPLINLYFSTQSYYYMHYAAQQIDKFNSLNAKLDQLVEDIEKSIPSEELYNTKYKFSGVEIVDAGESTNSATQRK